MHTRPKTRKTPDTETNINDEDKFLKVEITAYFPVNGLRIRKVESPDNEYDSILWLNGKEIQPHITFEYIEVHPTNPDERISKRIRDVEFYADGYTWEVSFLTRGQIWKDDPEFERFDAILMSKGNSEPEAHRGKPRRPNKQE